MRNALFATTALVAAGMMAVGPTAAQAQDGPAIKLALSGYYIGLFGFTDQDVNGNPLRSNRTPVFAAPNSLRDHTYKSRGIISFSGEGTLENGLSVGVRADLSMTNQPVGAGNNGANADNQIDKAYGYVQGAFGKIVFGDHLGAASTTALWAPYTNGYTGINSSFLSFQFENVPGGTNSNPTAGGYIGRPRTILTNISYDRSKVTYFTPRMAGFQFGMSYTPDNTKSANRRFDGMGLNNRGADGQIWEGAISYSNKFDNGLGLDAVVAYATGTYEKTGPADINGDPEAVSMGANLSYGEFVFGGSYGEGENGATFGGRPVAGQAAVKQKAWDLGLKYNPAPWTVGVAYSEGWTVDPGKRAAAGRVNYQNPTTSGWELGGAYNLGAGADLVAAVQFMKYEAADKTYPSLDATNFITGIILAF